MNATVRPVTFQASRSKSRQALAHDGQDGTARPYAVSGFEGVYELVTFVDGTEVVVYASELTDAPRHLLPLDTATEDDLPDDYGIL